MHACGRHAGVPHARGRGNRLACLGTLFCPRDCTLPLRSIIKTGQRYTSDEEEAEFMVGRCPRPCFRCNSTGDGALGNQAVRSGVKT
jgi:hypothetical protein